MTKTPNLSFDLIKPSQAQKELTVNEALTIIDGLLNNNLKAINVNNVPEGPNIGDLYCVGHDATGIWEGQRGKMALYSGGGWRYFQPKDGLMLWSVEVSGLMLYVNGGWTQLPAF